jgi:hypothetical protein
MLLLALTTKYLYLIAVIRFDAILTRRGERDMANDASLGLALPPPLFTKKPVTLGAWREALARTIPHIRNIQAAVGNHGRSRLTSEHKDKVVSCLFLIPPWRIIGYDFLGPDTLHNEISD